MEFCQHVSTLAVARSNSCWEIPTKVNNPAETFIHYVGSQKLVTGASRASS